MKPATKAKVRRALIIGATCLGLTALPGPGVPQETEAAADPDWFRVRITPEVTDAPIEYFEDAFIDLGEGRLIRFSDWIRASLAKSDLDLEKTELERLVERGVVARTVTGIAPEEREGDAIRLREEGVIGTIIGGRYRTMSLVQIAAAFGVAPPAGASVVSDARGIHCPDDPMKPADSGTAMGGQICFESVESLRERYGQP